MCPENRLTGDLCTTSISTILIREVFGVCQPRAETRVLEKTIPSQDWDVTDRGIYFIDGGASPVATVCFFDFAAKRVKNLAPVSSDPEFGLDEGLSVSPDGKWLIYCGGITASDIMLIDNFR